MASFTPYGVGRALQGLGRHLACCVPLCVLAMDVGQFHPDPGLPLSRGVTRRRAAGRAGRGRQLPAQAARLAARQALHNGAATGRDSSTHARKPPFQSRLPQRPPRAQMLRTRQARKQGGVCAPLQPHPMGGMRRTAAGALPAPCGYAMPYIPVAARPGPRDVCCCTRSFEMETCTCPRQQQAARGCFENLLLRASSQAMLLA